MIDLGAPLMLILLALLPAAALGWWWLWRARRLHQLLVGAAVAGERRGVLLARALLLLTLALIAVAAARPLWDAGEQTLGRSDFALVIALDVSLSMAAEDVGGEQGAPVSRMTAAKAEIRRLIDGRRGDRVGLVIFAGGAFLRFPLTRDHEAALQVLEALQPGEALVSPGSNLAAAIERAAQTIARAADDDGAERLSGAIAVVSDGETHAGDAAAAAAAARALGLQVFAVGVGSERGSGIPLGQSGTLKLDARSGAPILTRLDAAQLRQIADAGGGRYLELDAPGAMSSMNADLAALDLVRQVVVEETALAEQFQWFAVAAAFALLAATAARVFGWSLRRPLGVASLGALTALSALLVGCGGPGVGQANRDGVQHYQAGEYEEALEDWRLAQRRARRSEAAIDPRLHLNAGRALHQLGEYERAETETLAALRAESTRLRGAAWFQIGNHRWAGEDLLGARQAYIEALRETPNLLDAKINLELVNQQLAALQDDAAAPRNNQAGQGGGEGGAAAPDLNAAGESGAGQEGESSADESTSQASAGGAESGEAGQTAGVSPSAPSFSEGEPLDERRQQALGELREALAELPLENASLEQALAVLDALRAVPGERLAAGRLELSDQPLDW